MRRRRYSSKNTILLLIILLIVGIGIAYAVLTEQLTINNTVSYDAMKWDVGFTSAEDGYEPFIDAYIEMIVSEYGSLEELGFSSKEEVEEEMLYGAVVTPPITTISSDKKSMVVNCNFQITSKEQLCVLKAVITNDSTFNVALSKQPKVIYDDKYVGFINLMWINHALYGTGAPLQQGQTLDAGEVAEIIFVIRTRELTKELLPSSKITIPVELELDFEEVDYSVGELSMLTYNKETAFWSDDYRLNIKNITFENKINLPDNVIESWDLSLQKDGRVMSYIVPNEVDSTYYDLHIQSDEQLYANFNMNYWFSGFSNLDVINGMELLDTKFTTDMSYMFYDTGYNSSTFTLNLSNFDTSNVTNMCEMFWGTGYNSLEFTLDISNFDTSNVTNMHGMFWDVGYNSSVFTLDLSNFDTSNVTDMSYMFYQTGYSNSTFIIDTSHFDTSNVIDMTDMFYRTGYNSTNLVTSITIRNPNVISYSGMFYDVATKPGSQFTVNYTSETSDLVDQMISTKSTNSNVVKGIQVD